MTVLDRRHLQHETHRLALGLAERALDLLDTARGIDHHALSLARQLVGQLRIVTMREHEKKKDEDPEC